MAATEPRTSFGGSPSLVVTVETQQSWACLAGLVGTSADDAGALSERKAAMAIGMRVHCIHREQARASWDRCLEWSHLFHCSLFLWGRKRKLSCRRWM